MANPSPLAAGLIWAFATATSIGVVGFANNKWAGAHHDIEHEMEIAAVASGIAAYGERKSALKEKSVFALRNE